MSQGKEYKRARRAERQAKIAAQTDGYVSDCLNDIETDYFFNEAGQLDRIQDIPDMAR